MPPNSYAILAMSLVICYSASISTHNMYLHIGKTYCRKCVFLFYIMQPYFYFHTKSFDLIAQINLQTFPQITVQKPVFAPTEKGGLSPE